MVPFLYHMLLIVLEYILTGNPTCYIHRFLPLPLSFLSHRVFVGGHSAGAHLSACLLAMGGGVRGGGGEASCTPFAGAVLVSGIYELGPIQQCYVNDPLQLTT